MSDEKNDKLYNLDLTIEEAKIILRRRVDDGTKCPCCDQFVKRYKRKLNAGMAITLYRIYKHHKENYVNVKDFLRKEKYTNSHDWTLLKHWGMLETNLSGEWKITQNGKDWLTIEDAKTYSHIFIYNSKLQGFHNGKTTFKLALSDKFDYKELMQSLGGRTP